MALLIDVAAEQISSTFQFGCPEWLDDAAVSLLSAIWRSPFEDLQQFGVSELIVLHGVHVQPLAGHLSVD